MVVGGGFVYSEGVNRVELFVFGAVGGDEREERRMFWERRRGNRQC